MESEELDLLNRKKQCLNNWMVDYGALKDVLPIVEANLEMTEWEIDALNACPKVAGAMPPPAMMDAMKRDFEYLTEALPPIPDYRSYQLSASTSMTTSGTISMYDYVRSFGKYQTPEARNFVDTYTSRYHVLQEAQHRPEEVRVLVEKLKSQGALDRFDRARSSYLSAKAGVDAPTQAASEIRNFLYAVNGELLDKAQRQPGEKVTWLEMARRLAKPGLNDGPLLELVSQEAVYKNLTEALSPMAKDRKSTSPEELNSVWTLTLDHVFTVLGLVDLN